MLLQRLYNGICYKVLQRPLVTMSLQRHMLQRLYNAIFLQRRYNGICYNVFTTVSCYNVSTAASVILFALPTH